MIKLYPVLVSNSVSKNIIPGILKSVERFALIYKLDDLARSARKSAGISLRKVGKKVVMKESENDEEIAAFLANQILHEQFNPMDGRFDGPTGSKKKSQRRKGFTGEKDSPYSKEVEYARQSKEAAERERGKYRGQRLEQPPRGYTKKQKDEWYRKKRERDEELIAMAKERGKGVGRMQTTPADATIAIGQMDMRSIMLEPTWMKIDRVTKFGQKFTSVLGVKAVSVPVRSDATLAQLLTFDKNVGQLMHLVLKAGRYVTGKLYRLYARTIQRLVDPDPEAISGDPYKDIVLKRTILQDINVDDVFLVLNQADLEDDFAINAKGIRKLMSLGWQSFCIADDVNRRLTFCMREFKGMCNVLPYTMVYHSLDQAKVFEDLEDVRRSSTSLFKARLPMKRVIGESMARKKLEEFGADLLGPPPKQEQELLNEIAYIEENFSSLAKRVINSPKQFMTRLFKGNVKLPMITTDKALKIGKKVDPEFLKAHTLAKRVISNSIKEKVDERYLDWVAMAVVIRAKTLPGKNLTIKTKEVLMTVIPLIRKGLRKAKTTSLNIPPQHRVEAVFGLIAILGLVISIGYFYVLTLLGSAKIKPHVTETAGALKDFVVMAFKTIKDNLPSQLEDSKEFYSGFLNAFKTDFTKMFEKSKEAFEEFKETKTGEGGIIDNLKDSLKDNFDMSFGEAGVLLVLAIFCVYSLRAISGVRK